MPSHCSAIMDSVPMLRTASTFVFVCCLLMCDWALSTSWEAPSLEDAVGQSDLIGVFSEVRKQALESKPISCINSGRLSPKSPVVIGFMA